MIEATWTPNHGGKPKPGDHVAVRHDCRTDFAADGGLIRHETPVLVTAVDETTRGTRVRGVRCDASRIEWLLNEEGPTHG